jgi:hypothetical protein
VTNAITGSVTGNAGSATKLSVARHINGVAFDGSSDIIIQAQATSVAAANVSGTALPATITNSNLSVLGILTNLSVTGQSILGNVQSSAVYTNGLFWSNGATLNSGIKFTPTATPPASPNLGDQWYNTSSNILYEFQSDGTNQVWIDISSPVVSAASTNNISANVVPTANLTYNLGSTTSWWNTAYVGTIYGTTVHAQFADLAERYLSDANYGPGTVVIFGGPAEVTVTDQSHDRRAAGVVSTNPAYLMNSAEPGIAIALTGKVPCTVLGPIAKGDCLVTSNQPGVAERLNDALYKPGVVLGKSLEDHPESIVKVINVSIGKY